MFPDPIYISAMGKSAKYGFEETKCRFEGISVLLSFPAPEGKLAYHMTTCAGCGGERGSTTLELRKTAKAYGPQSRLNFGYIWF